MKRTIVYLAACLLSAATAGAQSASFLEIVPDARSAAMGATGVASGEGAFTIYHNSAALSLGTQKAGVGYSYTPWMNAQQSGYGMHTGAGYFRISPKIGTVTAGYRYFTLPKYEIIDNNGNSRGNFDPDEMSFDLGYAYAITEYLGVAINGRYIRSSMEDNVTGTAFAGDLSLFYRQRRFSAGPSLMNVGEKISYRRHKYEMPAKVRGGVSYAYPLSEKHALTGNAELAYKFLPSDYSGIEGGIGAEYTWNGMLSARAGYRFGEKKKTGPSYATVGLGVRLCRFDLDAAYLIAEKDSPLKDCFWLTLGVRF